MTKRYRIIKHNQKGYWFDDSPILLAAHALVKDNVTDTVYAQCKFGNLSPNTVEAVYIAISCIGVDGEPVESVNEYIYLDLRAAPGASFGDDRLVPLPDKTTRYYTVALNRVIFSDGSIWDNQEQKAFFSLAEPLPLSNLGHLEAQYRRVVPIELQDNLPDKYAAYWRCGCGQINLTETSNCVKCDHSLESQLLASDRGRLEINLARYIEQRKEKEQERIETARRKGERAKRQKKQIILVSITVVLIVLIVGYVVSVNRDVHRYAVAGGSLHTAALKSNGRVVAVGYNKYGQCNVSGWSGIVAVAAGNWHTVGLKSDGRVVAVGDNSNGRYYYGHGQCDVRHWRNIRTKQ